MSKTSSERIATMLRESEQGILGDWVKEQLSATALRPDLMSEKELRQQSAEFLKVLAAAVHGGNLVDTTASEWKDVRAMLADISRTRAEQGFGPSETATFVFSLKHPLFIRLRQQVGKDPEALAEDTWAVTLLLDKLGLYVTEVYQKSREAVISRQQAELLELSTPVTQLWEGILAVPLIGTLDSARTQVVMEALLSRIVETGADIAIIDITGVPTIDTQVAQHLLKTVSAARLMGAECIVSGVRPQIAQTIVTLGVDLGDVITKATLAAAFALAVERKGLEMRRRDSRS